MVIATSKLTAEGLEFDSNGVRMKYCVPEVQGYQPLLKFLLESEWKDTHFYHCDMWGGEVVSGKAKDTGLPYLAECIWAGVNASIGKPYECSKQLLRIFGHELIDQLKLCEVRFQKPFFFRKHVCGASREILKT